MAELRAAEARAEAAEREIVQLREQLRRKTEAASRDATRLSNETGQLRREARVARAAADELCCQICFARPKDTLFGCRHTTCAASRAQKIKRCPICRRLITQKVRFYS